MRTKKAQLIIISGFAGAGKTLLSKRLSKHFSIPRLGIDDLSRTLKSLKNLNHPNLNYYGIAYDLTFANAKNLLSVGTSVLIDINMCNPLSWREVKKLKKEVKNIQITIIVLECSFGVSADRVEKRRISNPSNYEIGKYNIGEVKYKYRFIMDKINKNKSPDIIVINTDKKTKKEVAGQAIEILEKRGIK